MLKNINHTEILTSKVFFIERVGRYTRVDFSNTLMLIMFLLITSCSSKRFESSEALQSYVQEEDQDYLQTKHINGVAYSLLYKPTDLLVAQEISEEATDSLVSSLRNKYSKYLYFTLSMSKNSRELLSNVVGNRNQFGAMVNELSFGMEQKVHLYTPKKDTLPMADYVYPRMYGMSGNTTMLFVYSRKQEYLKQKHLNFTIQDLGFGTGEVKFKVPTDIMKNEPIITF